MEDKIIRTTVKKYNVFHTCSTSAPPTTEVCHLPTVKHGSIMVWGEISWRGFGPLVILHERIKSNHYLSILEDHVHPFVQTVFPEERPLFQDGNAPIHTARYVQEWFGEHDDEVELLT
ncbi:transposable element Tcb1 transposase [Trichonephila clavipes]|uniref:Transposable element Tcb1 transposase n=1 Tax=Trichonephila clavipes TaxID=2585209 RepID=A0A8X7B7U7_TRICX|nr:transposable element Tcb1 transposase [Trichonephila clavipes]